MARQDKIDYFKLLKEKTIRKARTGLLYFTAFTMSTFEPADFHKRYYEKLDQLPCCTSKHLPGI